MLPSGAVGVKSCPPDWADPDVDFGAGESGIRSATRIVKTAIENPQIVIPIAWWYWFSSLRGLHWYWLCSLSLSVNMFVFAWRQLVVSPKITIIEKYRDLLIITGLIGCLNFYLHPFLYFRQDIVYLGNFSWVFLVWVVDWEGVSYQKPLTE